MTETDPTAVTGAYFDMKDKDLIDIPDGYHWDEDETYDSLDKLMKLVEGAAA